MYDDAIRRAGSVSRQLAVVLALAFVAAACTGGGDDEVDEPVAPDRTASAPTSAASVGMSDGPLEDRPVRLLLREGRAAATTEKTVAVADGSPRPKIASTR